jgi:hypothetical protein
VGSISATGLYTAPASITSSQAVTVTATGVADATKSGSATVNLSLTAVSVSPPSATLTAGQTQQFTATVTGTTNTAVTWSISPSVGSISATGLYTAPASITSSQAVTVTATGVADATKSGSATVNLAPPPPTVTITVPPTQVVTQPVTAGVQLSAATEVSVTGTLSLSFQPNAAGLVPGYQDPALQFAAGGTTLDFTIPAGATTVTLSQNGAIQQGTVAGDITVTLTRLTAGGVNILPVPAPSSTVPVPRSAPVIMANSVQIVNITATGFEVELTAYSTPRDLSAAAFVFSPASGGATLSGTTTYPLDLSSASTQWYASSAGLSSGSAFTMQVPFTFSGDASAVGSVQVTITNSVGTSNAVTGGQ